MRYRANSIKAKSDALLRFAAGIWAAGMFWTAGIALSGCDRGSDVLLSKDPGPRGSNSSADMSADILFWDDFETGDLHRWTVVNGDWDVIRVDGNRVARLKGGAEFGVINIRDLAVTDFSMRVRLRHVSGDDGANIYFYNNRTQENIGSDLGYWFGISGALDAIGWGESIGGSLRLSDIVVSETPLTWVELGLSLLDRRASMAVMREGVDQGFIPLFEVGPLATYNDAESLGLVVAGREVWVDDVLVLNTGSGP